MKWRQIIAQYSDFFEKQKVDNNKKFYFAVYRASVAASCDILYFLKQPISSGDLNVFWRWDICVPPGLKGLNMLVCPELTDYSK